MADNLPIESKKEAERELKKNFNLDNNSVGELKLASEPVVLGNQEDGEESKKKSSTSRKKMGVDKKKSASTKASVDKKMKWKKTENEIWLSVSEAAVVGGVQTKTIRRAIKAGTLRYKIVSNRYLINFKTLIFFLQSNTKLKNKLDEHGVGQYVAVWEMSD